MAGLTFITPLAYDYAYSYATIEAYYGIADEIILGVDKDRISWNNKPFEFDAEAVKQFIAGIDCRGIIQVLEGNFHEHANPKHNENQERMNLCAQAASGNWRVSIDSDEVILNGPKFKEWLLRIDPRKYAVHGSFLTVFKSFDQGQELLVCDPSESLGIATLQADGVRTGHSVVYPVIDSPLWALHHAWGRTPEELKQKITNWGHANDFDSAKYFQFWESITLDNYQEAKDFHPICPELWRSLKRVRTGPVTRLLGRV
jgi:hypothetical protein